MERSKMEKNAVVRVESTLAAARTDAARKANFFIFLFSLFGQMVLFAVFFISILFYLPSFRLFARALKL